jgi:hypothetical protein
MMELKKEKQKIQTKGQKNLDPTLLLIFNQPVKLMIRVMDSS